MTFEFVDLLPGFYFFALAALLLKGLGAWYDPVPKRAQAVFAMLILIFFGQVLFAGGVLLPLDNLRSSAPFRDLKPSPVKGFVMQADQLEDFAPYFSEVRRHLTAGEWPLMNPRVGAGEPLLVNSQAQHFHPLMVLTYLFPMSSAVGLIAALKVLLAFVFTFVLFRRLGLGEEAALAGSVAYGLGGFMVLYLGWPQTQSAAFLPLMLYALERAIPGLERRDLVLVALATSGLVLAGHPETMLYAVAMSGLFALVRLAKQPRPQALKSVLVLSLVGGGVALVAMPVLLPTFLYGKQSERYYTVEARRQNLLHERPAEPVQSDTVLEGMTKRALPVAAPVAYGSHRYGAYWGATTIFQDASGFVGSAALLAALLALGPMGSMRRFPAERLMLWVGAACWIVFVQPPGMKKLLAALPIVGHSASYHRRLTLILCLCIAYLAACTWERWRRHGIPRRRVVLVASGLALLIVWAYVAHPYEKNAEALAAYRGRWMQIQLLAILGATLLMLQNRSARSWAPWTLVLLVAVELSALHGDLNPPMPKRLYFPSDPSIEFLQQNVGDDRMVGLGPNFRHNLPVIYDVNDLRSGNPLQPSKVFLLIRPVRERVFSRRVTVANHPVYDLLGVRYVATRPNEHFGKPLSLVFQGDMWIYERPKPLARLFLPAQGKQLVDEEDWIDEVLAIKNYARRALFSEHPADEESWSATSNKARLEGLEIEATQITVQAHLDESRLLASSVYQDGGWRLLVDDELTPTVITNGAFVGAWLEAGEQQLEWLYRPPGFIAGCLIAAVASGALLVVLVVPGSRRRMAEAPAISQEKRVA